MSFRAYFLFNLPNSPSSTRPVTPVSLSTLSALGCTVILPSEDTTQNIEQTARKLAQNWGYPITQEGSRAVYDTKKDAENSPQAQENLTKFARIHETGFCPTVESLTAIAEGLAEVDIEDVTTRNWIRMEIPRGALIRMPAGIKFRFPLSEHAPNRKGVISDNELLFGKDIENHATRRAYLGTIGQA
ncbi:hypothetical protein BT96DRAFT_931863 [Gymnopus androsaceus JB14]|uniref:Uncharacterized protein n=1 Tax=Gymnopus androsaceus JB14 TaxID=1447944 RepID=A0A6A4IGE5_9AGAR|nr:hypothetical protein BT96DRAFT_931863 [Gymnopus androsaceus JB14]